MIQRAHGLCEVCRAQGKLVEGAEVHHIIKSRIDSADNYNLNNLIYVCKNCHLKIEGLSAVQVLEFIGGNSLFSGSAPRKT